METRFSALVCLAFCGSIGLMFLFLACALPSYGVWWPFFVVFFYVFAPVPIAIAKRYVDGGAGSGGSVNSAIDVAVFIVACIVVSAFGLPLILARAEQIKWGAAALVEAGNVVIFLTMLAYFLVFSNEDVDYSMW
ncbi:leptin receptor overlapping transcript-like 1 [Paramacrobiotus metropolitanus]|uniref:leptin receptor overlapping transcript-like 1 n=1 Tax=Paramacrobiotus metropolitanus TaxID=2943436 RepID=UPI002445EE78|nr:leptin receptor overlapping transcript-like 1 [Paramacrobiotus metropolitanus]